MLCHVAYLRDPVSAVVGPKRPGLTVVSLGVINVHGRYAIVPDRLRGHNSGLVRDTAEYSTAA